MNIWLRSESTTWGTFGWNEVLAYSRVVLLAEAGSGKTWEMEGQVRRLRPEGKIAFFLPLESLDRQALTDILPLDEGRCFDDWLSDPRSPAWLFLDSLVAAQ